MKQQKLIARTYTETYTEIQEALDPYRSPEQQCLKIKKLELNYDI